MATAFSFESLTTSVPFKMNEQIEITQNKLIDRVCFLVVEDGLTYLEALMEVAEENDMDHIDISKLVNEPLRHKLQSEAILNNSIESPENKSTAPSLFDL